MDDTTQIAVLYEREIGTSWGVCEVGIMRFKLATPGAIAVEELPRWHRVIEEGKARGYRVSWAPLRHVSPEED